MPVILTFPPPGCCGKALSIAFVVAEAVFSELDSVVRSVDVGASFMRPSFFSFKSFPFAYPHLVYAIKPNIYTIQIVRGKEKLRFLVSQDVGHSI